MVLISRFEVSEAATQMYLPKYKGGVTFSPLCPLSFLLVATLQCQEAPDKIREGELEMLPGDSSSGFLDHVASFNGKVNVPTITKCPSRCRSLTLHTLQAAASQSLWRQPEPPSTL